LGFHSIVSAPDQKVEIRNLYLRFNSHTFLADLKVSTNIYISMENTCCLSKWYSYNVCRYEVNI